MAKHHPDLIFCRKQAGVGETASMAAAPWVGAVLGVGESGFHLSPRSCSEAPRFPPSAGSVGARRFLASNEKAGERRGAPGAGGPGGVRRNSWSRAREGLQEGVALGNVRLRWRKSLFAVPASVPTPNSRMFFYSSSES